MTSHAAESGSAKPEPKTESLAEALPREIERVIEVRKLYEEMRQYPNVLVEPQIAMMSAAISQAIRASAAGDVLEMLRAYEDLKGWVE